MGFWIQGFFFEADDALMLIDLHHARSSQLLYIFNRNNVNRIAFMRLVK